MDSILNKLTEIESVAAARRRLMTNTMQSVKPSMPSSNRKPNSAFRPSGMNSRRRQILS